MCSYIAGVGLTRFGALPQSTTLGVMSEAAAAALEDAGLERGDIDGVICGYSTAMPHLMLSAVFGEHFGLKPAYAHALQLGGATGFAMVMAAHLAVLAGAARRVLVVAGENRLTGAGRDASISTLAQIGHPLYEVPLGPTVPSYYALLASRYLYEHDIGERDLAELAVLMRTHAAAHPGAHFREPISVEDVLRSRPVSTPLKLLDCCPVSDGGAAVVVTSEPLGEHCVAIRGAGQAHRHQHVSAMATLTASGAGRSSAAALSAAGVRIQDIGYLAVYDSFTVTLALLLEEIGFAPPGRAGALARDGSFSPGGRMPLNTHGRLLSFGHCGVAGAMVHLVEAHLQLTGRAANRQLAGPALALAHGDGGVLSSHVTLVLSEPG